MLVPTLYSITIHVLSQYSAVLYISVFLNIFFKCVYQDFASDPRFGSADPNANPGKLKLL